MARGFDAFEQGTRIGGNLAAPFQRALEQKAQQKNQLEQLEREFKLRAILGGAKNPETGIRSLPGSFENGEFVAEPPALSDQHQTALDQGGVRMSPGPENYEQLGNGVVVDKDLRDQMWQKKLDRDLQEIKAKGEARQGSIGGVPVRWVEDENGQYVPLPLRMFGDNQLPDINAVKRFKDVPRVAEDGTTHTIRIYPNGTEEDLGVRKGVGVTYKEDEDGTYVPLPTTLTPGTSTPGTSFGLGGLGGGPVRKPQKPSPEDKKFVETLSTKNANKISVANQLDEILAQLEDPNLDEKTKVKVAQSSYKIFNSPEGQDAVQQAEAERIGGYVEYNMPSLKGLFDPATPFMGRDLPAFQNQLREMSKGLRKGAASNEKNIQERNTARQRPGASKQGQQLSREKVAEYLKRAGNDRDKARELAAQDGFQF